MKRHPFTTDESDYIRRVAGRVPVEIIAKTLRRSVQGIQRWAYRRGLKLSVPDSVMRAHWQDVIDERRKNAAEN